MATRSTYYIDSNSFNTAISVYTNSELTIKAPDGYYSFNGLHRRQLFGKLQTLLSCTSTPPPPPPPSYYAYLNAPTFVESSSGGAATCTYFTNPNGNYVRNDFYASKNNLQVGDAVYRDSDLNDRLIPVMTIYFAYTENLQTTVNKWIRINDSGYIDQIGSC